MTETRRYRTLDANEAVADVAYRLSERRTEPYKRAHSRRRSFLEQIRALVQDAGLVLVSATPVG